MYMGLWMTGNPVVDLPLTALVWFILGMLAGRHVSRWPAWLAGRGGGSGGGGDGEGAEVYVGNLAYEIGEKDLVRLFSEFGRVVSTRIIRQKFGGKSKGFGFVTLSTQGEADAAMRAMNGKDVKGRKLVVSQAKSRAR